MNKQKLIIGVSEKSHSVHTEAIIDPGIISMDDAYELAKDVIERFYEEYEDDES